VNQLKVGVVGCGYWGPNLIRNFYENERVELRYICDLIPEKLTRMARRYVTTRTTVNYQDLLNDPELDAIVIATRCTRIFALRSKRCWQTSMCSSRSRCA